MKLFRQINWGKRKDFICAKCGLLNLMKEAAGRMKNGGAYICKKCFKEIVRNDMEKSKNAEEKTKK